MSIQIHNEDCLPAMRQMKDNEFDLAIVDPPYGIGMDKTVGIGIGKKKGFHKKKNYISKTWDKSIPTKEYFNELFRISKNQIIWGANYFTKELPILKNYIFWYKKGQSVDDKFNDGELAFTSMGRTRMVSIWWNGVGVINSSDHVTTLLRREALRHIEVNAFHDNVEGAADSTGSHRRSSLVGSEEKKRTTPWPGPAYSVASRSRWDAEQLLPW